MKTKTLLLFSGILFFSFFLHAQAVMKFDTTVYDLGIITQGQGGSGIFKKDIKFTNTGKEPLIIQSASTGDGGSMCNYPKEPIRPGQNGAIQFIYDINRIGPFNRSVSISSNANSNYTVITVKGEVVYARTEISVPEKEKNIGTLNFGETDTVEFVVLNAGKFPLNFSFNMYNYPESDLMWMKVEHPQNLEKNNSIYYNYSRQEATGDTIKITCVMKNIYGNAGNFVRPFYFTYNSHDTIALTVKGIFSGTPPLNKITEGNNSGCSTYIYENNVLVKKEFYNSDGVLNEESFYSGPYCTRKKTHYCETFYDSGKITKQNYFKN